MFQNKIENFQLWIPAWTWPGYDLDPSLTKQETELNIGSVGEEEEDHDCTDNNWHCQHSLIVSHTLSILLSTYKSPNLINKCISHYVTIDMVASSGFEPMVIFSIVWIPVGRESNMPSQIFLKTAR